LCPFREILTSEVKAAALVLLAMKLMFRLDDSQEYRMEVCTNNTLWKKAVNFDLFKARQDLEDAEVFEFHTWMTQLRLRTHVRRGRSIEDVLREQ